MTLLLFLSYVTDLQPVRLRICQHRRNVLALSVLTCLKIVFGQSFFQEGGYPSFNTNLAGQSVFSGVEVLHTGAHYDAGCIGSESAAYQCCQLAVAVVERGIFLAQPGYPQPFGQDVVVVLFLNFQNVGLILISQYFSKRCSYLIL